MTGKADRKKNLITKLSLFLSLYDFAGKLTVISGQNNRSYTDPEIMEGILRGDIAVFNYLKEKSLPLLLKITGLSLKSKLAEKVIQDAFIVVYRKLSTTGIELHCRFLTYFVAVARKIWMFESNPKRMNGFDVLQEHHCTDIDDFELENLWMESMEFRLYRWHFYRLNEKQQKILQASMDGIAYKDLYTEFGYKSVESFKNEVSRIKRKLSEKIAADPLYQKLKNRNNWSYDRGE